MYRNLIIINLIVILLVTTVYILGHYFINYPMPFDLWYILKECQLQYLLAVFIIIGIVSYLISSLDFKKLSFKGKFLRVFPALNSLILIFLTYTASAAFVKNKKDLSSLEKHYIQEVESDIKKDQIVMRYSGFFIPTYDDKTANQVNSIYKKYGVVSKNTGCIIDAMDTKAQEKYNELADIYLEKRNGKGWKIKMKKEIDDLKKINNSETK